MDEEAYIVHISTLLMIAYQLLRDTCMVVVVPSTEYESCVQFCALHISLLLHMLFSDNCSKQRPSASPVLSVTDNGIETQFYGQGSGRSNLIFSTLTNKYTQ